MIIKMLREAQSKGKTRLFEVFIILGDDYWTATVFYSYYSAPSRTVMCDLISLHSGSVSDLFHYV